MLVAAGYFELDSERVQASFVWLVDAMEKVERRHIAAVIRDLHARNIHDPDPVDIGESVAALRGSRPDRRMLEGVAPIVASRYPGWGKHRVNELARSGTVWTVAELLGEDLDVDTKAAAQGWAEEKDASAAGWTGPNAATRPTMADMRTVAATVTIRELEAVQALAEAKLGTKEAHTGFELHPYVLIRMLAQMRMVHGAGAGCALSDDLVELIWGDAVDANTEEA